MSDMADDAVQPCELITCHCMMCTEQWRDELPIREIMQKTITELLGPYRLRVLAHAAADCEWVDKEQIAPLYGPPQTIPRPIFWQMAALTAKNDPKERYVPR